MVTGKAETKVVTCGDCRYCRWVKDIIRASILSYYCGKREIAVDPSALRHCDYYVD